MYVAFRVISEGAKFEPSNIVQLCMFVYILVCILVCMYVYQFGCVYIYACVVCISMYFCAHVSYNMCMLYAFYDCICAL